LVWFVLFLFGDTKVGQRTPLETGKILILVKIRKALRSSVNVQVSQSNPHKRAYSRVLKNLSPGFPENGSGNDHVDMQLAP